MRHGEGELVVYTGDTTMANSLSYLQQLLDVLRRIGYTTGMFQQGCFNPIRRC